jgi:hypothetical protein
MATKHYFRANCSFQVRDSRKLSESPGRRGDRLPYASTAW